MPSDVHRERIRAQNALQVSTGRALRRPGVGGQEITANDFHCRHCSSLPTSSANLLILYGTGDGAASVRLQRCCKGRECAGGELFDGCQV